MTYVSNGSLLHDPSAQFVSKVSKVSKLIDVLLAYLSHQVDNTMLESQLTDAEWEALLRLATRHNVAPLLYHRLNTGVSNVQVSDNVLAYLRKVYYHNALRNARYYRELSEVLKLLQRSGIEVIVLKGAFLAKTVYQSEALRAIGDIDLLVKPADLAQAEKILLEMGYGPTERPNIKEQCALHHHLITFRKAGAFDIEIHWNLHFQSDSPVKINIDTLWEHTQPFTVADIQVLSLSPENLLLHLCFHTCYANIIVGMRFLCDIDNTIRYYQDEIDWDLLFSRAHQWGAVKPVYLALYLAKNLLAAHVPEKVLERFKPGDFNLEMVAKIKEIIAGAEILTVDINKMSINVAVLWSPKSFREKLSIILGRIFISPKKLANTYHVPENSLRVYFYYPVRLRELLVRYSGKVWRMLRLRGDKKMQSTMAYYNRITMLKDWMGSK